MKLGLAVVYLVADQDEQLLDLHLNQIAQNTPEPYTIYAAANRLPTRFRAKLAERSEIKICDIPSTDLRQQYEHSYYLERLVSAAIDDGATHVCTLHVDSFPVRRGWATELAARLNGDCVLASLLIDPLTRYQPSTALLMFPRQFYLDYRPMFLPPDEFYDTPAYRPFAEAWAYSRDSGIGYAITVFEQGLAWLPLTCSNLLLAGRGAGVFGGVLFHLGGTSRARQDAPPPPAVAAGSRLLPLIRPLKRWMPALWHRVARLMPGQWSESLSIGPWERRRAELIADPSGFLSHLIDEANPPRWEPERRSLKLES